MTAYDELKIKYDSVKTEVNALRQKVKTRDKMLIKLRKAFIEQGGVLFNDRGKKVFFFKMFGKYWTTNKKRKTIYKLDDIGWVPLKDFSWFKKLSFIINGSVKALNVNKEE